MDPLSHVALGRTLVALGPEARNQSAIVAAGTLGAISPDIDALLMPFGWDVYLRAHEIGTHTILGTIACALLTASIVRLVSATAEWRPLALAGWGGAASHVALDVLSSARVRVLWPFDDRHVSVPLVAMADPWLASILIGGGIAVLAARQSRRRVSGFVLAAGVTFLVMKGALASRALDAYRAVTSDGASEARIVEAKWATVFQWYVFDRSASQLRVWRATVGSAAAELVLTWPSGVETTRVKASRSLSAVRNFLHVHDLPFAATVGHHDGHESVLWSDIRYCWNPDAANAPRLEPIVGTPGARLACALWFGAEFDHDGRAIRQIVKVAGLTQTRGVSE